MLWNTLKAKVVQYVSAHPENDGSKHIQAMATHTKLSLDDLLNRVGVDGVGTLRDVIPAAFPKTLRTGPLVGHRIGDGAWRVKPMAMMPRSRDNNSGGYIL